MAKTQEVKAPEAPEAPTVETQTAVDTQILLDRIAELEAAAEKAKEPNEKQAVVSSSPVLNTVSVKPGTSQKLADGTKAKHN